MSFTLPDIDVGSWAEHQKRELQRQMDEKIQSFGLEQAINEKMSGLHELAGGVQETFGGVAEAAGGVAPAVGGAADDRMQQIQQALAATQPTFDQPATSTQPAPMPAPPQELLDRGANAAPMPGPPQELIDRSAGAAPMDIGSGLDADRQRQIDEALERTRPQIQAVEAEPDRVRQLQDMLGQTRQAVSEQLSRFTPSPSAAPSVSGGGVNPQPTPAEVQAYITESAAARGIDPSIALRVAKSEGGFEAARRGTFKTGSSWWPFQLHYGGAGYEHLGDTAGMGNQFTKETGFEPGDPNAWQAATDYALDRAKKSGWGAWYGARDQGITGFAGIDRSVPDQPGLFQQAVDRGKAAAGGVVGGVQQAATGAIGQVSQFGDAALSAGEAAAACGPAAAVRFAQRFGRNPSLREAVDMAKSVGWTAQQGMAGIASEHKLMEKLGVPVELVMGRDWNRVTQEAQTGNPVTISTSKHYFTIDDYNPETGKYHVGSSGTDLRGGSDWMSSGQMEAALGGGTMQGALIANNPTVSAGSTAQSGDTDQRIASVAQPSAKAQTESLLEQLQRSSEEHSTRGRAWLDEQTRNLEQAVTQAGQDVTATNRPTPMDLRGEPNWQVSEGVQSQLRGEDVSGKVAGAAGVAGEFLEEISPATHATRMVEGVASQYRLDPEVNRLTDALWEASSRGDSSTAMALQQQLSDRQLAITQQLAASGGFDPATVYERGRTSPGAEQAELLGNVLAGGAGFSMAPQGLASGGRAAAASLALDPTGLPFEAIGPLVRGARQAGTAGAEAATTLGGGAAGGIAGWETSEGLPLEERIARTAGGVGIGLAGGYGAGRVLTRPGAAAAVADVAGEVPAGAVDEAVPTRPGAIPSARPLGPETPRVESTEGLGHTNIQVGKYVPEEVRQIIQDAYDAAPEAMEAARRHIKPDEAIKEMAGELGSEAAHLINLWKPGQAKNAETIYAMRQALADQSQRVVEAQQVARADPTSVDAKLKLTAEITRQRAVQEAITGVTAEAGRAVRQFRQTVEGQSAISAYLERMARAKGMKPDELADQMIKVDLSDPVSRGKFIREMNPKTTWDKAAALWYFSLLSSPTTHIRNTVGNALTTATTPFETGLAAVFDPVARGAIKAIKAGGETAGAEVGGRERFFGEAAADAFGAVSSIKSGLGNAARAYSKGMDPSKMSQSDLEELARMEVFSGKTGAVVHAPGRALQAADAGFRTLNEQAAGYRMAYRQAAKENVPWDKTIDRITEIMRNPDKDFLDEMVKQGTYRTFQNDTGLSEGLVQLRARVPALRFLLPFVRTPINILRYGLERSPLALGKMIAEGATEGGRRGLAERGAGDLADRMGRMTMGSLMMGGLTLWGKDNLTGRAPSDPAERDAFYRQGKQPYSFKGPNGDWYSYQALQPYTSIFATAAELSESMAEGSLKDPNNIPGLAATAAVTIGQSMLDMPWTQGLADAIDLVTNNGPDADNIEKKIGEWTERQASGLVPGAMRQLARANDNIVRDPQNPLQAMLANIPGTQGLAEQYPEQLGGLAVPERLDVFGGARERPTEGWESVLSPFNRSEPTDDPVELELQRLQLDRGFDVQPGFVGKKVTAYGQPVELEDPQERFYQTTSGQLTYAALQLLVGSKEWNAMPDAEKVKTVDTISSRIREATREQMEPSLLPQALNKVIETQRRRGPEPTPSEPAPTSQPTREPGGIREGVVREGSSVRGEAPIREARER